MAVSLFTKLQLTQCSPSENTHYDKDYDALSNTYNVDDPWDMKNGLSDK